MSVFMLPHESAGIDASITVIEQLAKQRLAILVRRVRGDAVLDRVSKWEAKQFPALRIFRSIGQSR
jgi:hypothetical protein